MILSLAALQDVTNLLCRYQSHEKQILRRYVRARRLMLVSPALQRRDSLSLRFLETCLQHIYEDPRKKSIRQVRRLSYHPTTHARLGHGAGGVIAIRVYRSFSIDSSLSFSIVEVPAVGSCRVFDRAGENAELVHLAASRQAAEEWLTRHGYPSAVLEDVTADEVAGNAGQGRAVA